MDSYDEEVGGEVLEQADAKGEIVRLVESQLGDLRGKLEQVQRVTRSTPVPHVDAVLKMIAQISDLPEKSPDLQLAYLQSLNSLLQILDGALKNAYFEPYVRGAQFQSVVAGKRARDAIVPIIEACRTEDCDEGHKIKALLGELRHAVKRFLLKKPHSPSPEEMSQVIEDTLHELDQLRAAIV